MSTRQRVCSLQVFHVQDTRQKFIRLCQQGQGASGSTCLSQSTYEKQKLSPKICECYTSIW